MKCDNCRNKDYFDTCKWPAENSCKDCPCNECEICGKQVHFQNVIRPKLKKASQNREG